MPARWVPAWSSPTIAATCPVTIFAPSIGVPTCGLGRLILRLYEEETDLPIYLFVDASLSMGTDGGKKLDYAKKVAAALAYVGLSNLDRVNLVVYAEGDYRGAAGAAQQGPDLQHPAVPGARASQPRDQRR